MKRTYRLLDVTLVLAIVAMLVGCGSTDEPASDEKKPAAQPHGNGGMQTDMGDPPSTEIAASLARLSDEDRAIAEKQVNCPVSGQPLGSMGVPVKVTVKGRDVLLCCQGCQATIEEDPEKYLALLPD